MIYFISDVHLGYFNHERGKQVEKLLIDLFDAISKDCKVLVIVGDLFDFWFDYKTVIPKHFFRVVSKLDELRTLGIEIIYIMGNHDFGHYKFFQQELGIEVFESDIEREFFGKKFYISHGDGKIQNDFGYLVLKSILRNKFARFLFRFIHPDLGICVAKSSSKKSRKYSSMQRNNNFDSLFEFSKKKIEQGFDFVIMGHSHKFEFKKYKNGYYLNLGDWFNSPYVGIFDGNELTFQQVAEFIENKIKV